MLSSTVRVTSHAKFKLPVCANSPKGNRKIMSTKKRYAPTHAHHSLQSVSSGMLKCKRDVEF